MLRYAVAIILLMSLTFADYGGGGPSLKVFTLDKNYSCSDGKVIVTAADNNGPLPGVELSLSKFSGDNSAQTAVTDQNGQATFTLKEDGAYQVVGTMSGYSLATVLVSVKACNAAPSQTVYCNVGALNDRVLCIMNLPDNDVLNVHFIPEECRVLNDTDQQKCIATYRVLESCRLGIESDLAREMCIKPKLNLTGNISAQLKACNGDNSCINTIKSNVFTLVKFRIYNLIYKAEQMRNMGVSQSDVVDFVAYVEDAKIRFNNAATIADKEAIVNEIKGQWETFKTKAKSQLGVSG